MATLTTAGIHTLSLTDGTTYTVEVRIDEAALAEALGRKALYNRTGVAKEVGGLVVVRTVDGTAARLALQASRDACTVWDTRITLWREGYHAAHGLTTRSVDWEPAERIAYKHAEAAWIAANPKPKRVTYR